MAHCAPLPSELKARMPQFASIANTTVEAFIEEANRQVDESWTEGDYALAIMYLAAHLMLMEGLLTPAGQPSPITTAPLTSWSMGDASESYASSRAGDGDGGMGQYGATEYGQRFVALRRRNVGGPVVI